MIITLELTPELFNNLRVMVLAGGKNNDSGADGLMMAAQLLQIMAQAQEQANAPKPNGHASEQQPSP